MILVEFFMHVTYVAVVWMFSECSFGLYIYAFGRNFNPERLCIEGLHIISSYIPWELNPWPVVSVMLYLHKINMFISLRKMKILYMIKLVFYTNHCSEHERSEIGSQTVPFNCLSSIKTFLNWSLVHICVYVTL